MSPSSGSSQFLEPCSLQPKNPRALTPVKLSGPSRRPPATNPLTRGARPCSPTLGGPVLGQNGPFLPLQVVRHSTTGGSSTEGL